MASLTLQATKTPGAQSVTITRSTDDALGSAIAALVVDNTLTALQVREAFADLAKAILEDFRLVSAPSQVGGPAFSDGATFSDDDALFSDQDHDTWLATLAGDNATTITRDDSGAIGSAAMALLIDRSKGKPELWHYLRGIERELLRLGREFTDPSDYPTTGSRVS